MRHGCPNECLEVAFATPRQVRRLKNDVFDFHGAIMQQPHDSVNSLGRLEQDVGWTISLVDRFTHFLGEMVTSIGNFYQSRQVFKISLEGC